MKTYKENGTYVLEADDGKYLTDGNVYTKKIYSSRTVKMTDWTEVSSLPIIILTDEELLNDFTPDILESISIVRGTRKMTHTKVSYRYDSESHSIIEEFS